SQPPSSVAGGKTSGDEDGNRAEQHLMRRSFTSSRSGAIRGRVRFSGEILPVQIPRHEPTLPSHVRFVEVARRPNVFALVQHLGPSYPTRPTFDMSGRRRLAGG